MKLVEFKGKEEHNVICSLILREIMLYISEIKLYLAEELK